jgi:hypothetical protein
MRSGMHPHRHVHRERRFRRPRQSLGFGYYAFDVVPSLPSASQHATPATPEPEAVPEIEKHREATRKVLRLCAVILLCTFWVYTASQNTTAWRAWLERLQAWLSQ